MKKVTTLCVITLSLIAQSAAAAIPHTLNLQSLVYKENGQISDAVNVDVGIRLLDTNETVLFSETHNDVPLLQGAINLDIGSLTAGGIPLDAIDPVLGTVYLDILFDNEDPFGDPLPLAATPYALWAERALSVDDSVIESRHIKDGTIQVEDLAPGLAFSNLEGQANDSQIPDAIVRISRLQQHENSTTAHPASSITVQGPFVNYIIQNAQEGFQKIDEKIADEVVNRREIQAGLNAHLTPSNTNAHSFSNISGQINGSQIAPGAVSGATLTPNSITSTQIQDNSILVTDIFQSESDPTSLDARYVNEGGDTINGDLTVNGNVNVSGRVDGVDVSNLNDLVQSLLSAITNFSDIQGQVNNSQVPSYMRPLAFGNLRTNSTAVTITNGYNLLSGSIQGSCLAGNRGIIGRVNFTSALPDTNYIVLLTSTGFASGELPPSPIITSKNQAYFEYCQSTDIGTDILVFHP